MCFTFDDLAVTLVFCGVAPLLGLWLVLLLLPVYVTVAVWVIHPHGGV